MRGLVQGVGFRPTVWRLAKELALTGEVLNDGEGVLIRAWGSVADLDALAARLRAEQPPLARIDSIEALPLSEGPPAAAFEIVASAAGRVWTGVLPDAATCPACLSEIMDPENRRFRYPFTNCTHCGPRLSIVAAVPYDRANTSMAAFPMCHACQTEYEDPSDRRFHAQPNACADCGPRLWLEDADTGEIDPAPHQDAIEAAAALIAQGAILAIKGIGGFHLACDATNEAAVTRLRQRKKRYDKPFALMARDPAMIARYAAINEAERTLLAAPAAPIVILQTGPEHEALAAAVAPGQSSLGFMLPYTPLHHLLMQSLDRLIVLTSGNRSDEPQCIGNEEARSRLAGIADHWLMHDREILNRLDDSVVRSDEGGPTMLRRARGYAPAPHPLPPGFENSPPLLALGGELKATVCLWRQDSAVVSQHIGDLEDASVHDDYRKTLSLYRQLFDFAPAGLAVDRHPDYLSTQWGAVLAEREDLPLIQVQHHHAHIAACLAEHGVARDAAPVLGLVLDGLGYGEDGTLWGGEFLLANYRGFRRLGHFKPMVLLGGAQAMREPWRNAYAYLEGCIGWPEVVERYPQLDIVRFLQAKPLALLDQMKARGVNAPLAVSAGRLFDAVAAALSIRPEATSYEGQAAIELEALAQSEADERAAYGFVVTDSDPAVLDWTPLWHDLLNDVSCSVPRSVIAKRFHNTVAEAVTQLARRLADEHRTDQVVLSGGVFQNRLLLGGVSGRLEAAGLAVLRPSLYPANDGGIALGQAAVAAARLLEDT